MKRCVVFPGQGTQFTGMGKELFSRYPDEVALADSVLGYSISSVCLDNSAEKLHNTAYAQPAILFVSYLIWLESQKKEIAPPDFFAGHSLGEYTALLASGVIDLQTALQLVQKRGALMAQAPKGAMAAIMNMQSDTLQRILFDLGIELEIANYNTPLQTVVAGTSEAVSILQSELSGSGAYCIPLPVSGAFHSSHMKEAAEIFRKTLEGVTFRKFSIPVLSNVTGRPHDIKSMVELLTSQMYSSVQWVSSIRWIEQQGDVTYDECGPKSILLPMIETIKKGLPPKEVQRKPRQKHFGSGAFMDRYNLVEPVMAGAMYRGISSPQMVTALAKAGYLGAYGTGGLNLETIQEGVQTIRNSVPQNASFAVNLLAEYSGSGREMKTVQLLLDEGVSCLEAAAFVDISPALALFKIKGLQACGDRVESKHRIIAKVSHHRVAQKFLSTFSEDLLERMEAEELITSREAALARKVTVADDLTVEADSGGHTDQKAAFSIFPAMKSLRDEMAPEVHIGLAGGIGTPEAALAAFMMGADYIVTGSINQATVESGQSEVVKSLLSTLSVNDTTYAPAGDMFEVGAMVQVVKKGALFPMRAQRLFELYRQYQSLDDIPQDIKTSLEEGYFKKSFEEVVEQCRRQLPENYFSECMADPQKRVAMLFKHYFSYASEQALTGGGDRTNYQIHCGSAMGAFNQWVKGTSFESWQKRRVATVTEKLLSETYELFRERTSGFSN